MPYVCIFPDCDTVGRLYERREDWFSHLQQKYSLATEADLEFSCPLCLEQNPHSSHMEKHLGGHLEELVLFALPDNDNRRLNINDTGAELLQWPITPATRPLGGPVVSS